MKQGIKSLIKPVPFVKGLNEQLRKRGAYPAGHYYSPVPSRADVLSYLRARTEAPTELPGIDLTTRHQRDVLEDYIGFYQDLPFPERKAPTHRYYFDNGWFGDFDARFLYAFLRKHLPKRIIEVGSEFSSAVMLDTVDGYFSQAPKITFIEPYPDRLIGLFREGDRERVRLIDQKIQDVPLDTLRALESGDLLFIDSSHVLKCGSDLQFLLFEILPRLRPGVFVHFHDVFYPSDYPDEWFVQGRILERKLFSKSRPFIQCRVAHRVFQHLCASRLRRSHQGQDASLRQKSWGESLSSASRSRLMECSAVRTCGELLMQVQGIGSWRQHVELPLGPCSSARDADLPRV